MSKESTEEQKEKIIKSLNEEFIEKALKIFNDAKNNKVGNKIEKLSYRKVDAEEAKKLKDKTGLDLEGYEHNITNMDVRHIYKNHGDERSESFRGQRAVTEKDILLIPEITENYDDAMLADKKNKSTNLDAIIYRKRIGDEFFYIETVSGQKSKELRSVTMWIVKK